ncbi:MAG: hypothetical protein ACOC7N_06240, partial [Chloroflexota bacterium]
PGRNRLVRTNLGRRQVLVEGAAAMSRKGRNLPSPNLSPEGRGIWGVGTTLEAEQAFKGQVLLTQPDTGKAMSINFWETEGALSAFESSPRYGELMSKLSGVLAAPPEGDRYQVAVRT